MNHRTLPFLLLFLLMTMTTMAQTTLQGEYYFNRQEMVSAFRFLPDGKFEFFFSYGASDRTAHGTFTVVGDTLKLKSDKVPGEDVRVDKQYKKGDGIIIKCKAPDKQLLPYMQAIIVNGNETEVVEADAEGLIKTDKERCDKLYISCVVIPDIPTLIKDENNPNNRFEVTLLPIVQEVSFKGIDFKIEDDSTISCLFNYVFMLDKVKFRKQ